MTATSTLATLASLTLSHDYSFSLTVNPVAVGILVVLIVIVLAIRWQWFGRSPNFEIDTAEMGIGSHKISFKPNLRDQEIAYKIWVELSTRKIGLPIDLEHDVISEIYDSWHNFFSITRELIKDIPVNKVKNQSTRKIITLSITLLNKGLRPHLTTWQARFRRWYDRQLENAKDDVDPQSIQAKYPRFKELKEDMETVNKRLILYREKMHELVLGLSDEGLEEAPPATPSL
ncbi:MAG: hypothetical protein KGI73_00985 [Patescibacteria group bacterium]|nr:hypothetical protein [Patescibacteria group bacterium]